ncbi:MAG: hypothetical protein PUD63_12220 [Clostridia bacterium]|nr:hypothetical protein [Clostridia bacterium]
MFRIETTLLSGEPIGISVEDTAVPIGIEASAQYIGNAETAKRLAQARTIAIHGEARGETLFDGSEDASIYTVVEKITNEELEEWLK